MISDSVFGKDRILNILDVWDNDNIQNEQSQPNLEPIQGYLVLGFLSILAEKLRPGGRSDSGECRTENLKLWKTK